MNNRATSRRGFLRRSVMAGASIAACGLAARGADANTSAKPQAAPLRWGVIGTGHRGSIHLNAIKSFENQCAILGVCDVMENHLAAGAKRAGAGVATYSDYQKLLPDKNINAVLIATPNCVHSEVVLAALQAGKHVMCEKPMAVSVEECKAMKEAAAQRPDQVVLYTMQLHYSPRFAVMRKCIDEGKIGKPKHMLFAEYRGDWNRGDVWQYDDPKQGKVNWRFSQAASGGTLNEKVCHYFDILHWMAGGLPQRVSCRGGISVYKDGRDTWDHATTTLTYADGLQATHDLCMFGPKRLDLEVIGDEGSLFMDEKGLTLKKGKTQEAIELPDEIAHGERGQAKGQETAVLKMYQDFIDCVKNNKKPWMDADKAMASSKTAWLGELSNERKREVGWDDIG
jgi:predicted dehydrogenase